MLMNSIQYRNALRSLFPFLPDKGNETVLITGATGLIGSCMADALLFSNTERNTDYHVIVLGRNEARLRERFSYARPDGRIVFIAQDINLPVSSGIQPDIIIHAASNADPVAYALYPAQTLLTNIYGTKNMLDLAKENGAKLLLTSTFEVYGKIEDQD
ncbi:MAG: NAD-dependent epimerase/dehydratase family protein, partial [Clostridia bacterium]|nr:NAD-dependent epimerase/dehydratase family protein [Clostridia bacterium]